MSLAQAYWAVAPGQGELRVEPAASTRLTMLYSGISRGTETLVARGLVPEDQWPVMRCPHQAGDFPFPVKYGYQAVATDGTDNFFALFPHQTHFDLPPDQLHLIPADVPPKRAILAANMETALNAMWDAQVGPGDRLAVIGAGVVGALVVYLAARMPGCEVTLCDVIPERAQLAASLGCRFAAIPDDGMDLVFHTSATAAGLQAGVDALGIEGRLIELSWYGQGQVPVGLGGNFHSRRLTIQASQVGQVAANRRPRWDYRRRLGKALALLADPVLDTLIDREVAFADLPEHMAALAAGKRPGLCTAVVYDQK